MTSRRPQLTAYKRNLAIRDGAECFYCGVKKPKDKLTIEHMLNVSYGGSHKVENLALACKSCNLLTSKMSVVGKFKFRESKRSEFNVRVERIPKRSK